MISGGTRELFPLMMLRLEAFDSFDSLSSISLKSSSEACRIMVIFLDRGTGGVEGCDAFMLSFELCRVIKDRFELPESSLLISDRLARGASGELTGLFCCFCWLLGLRNFMKSLRDFRSLSQLLFGT